jgi:hypothetical protein
MDRNLTDGPQDNVLTLDTTLYSNPGSKSKRMACKTKVYGLI